MSELIQALVQVRDGLSLIAFLSLVLLMAFRTQKVFRALFITPSSRRLSLRSRDRGMATASLRYAPRKNGHSAGVLTVAAAAGVIHAAMTHRVDNPLILTLVANHRRRRSARARGRFTS